ncbi:hypothetical protein GQ53DRAFT_681650 [Thozetella sp. PMI_491]|nr:hypothetical protein GQ53DRAFT_681650 [Thozetella sp. PMI_491]
MVVDIAELDAHEQPSDELKGKWKVYSRADQKDLLQGPDIDDLSSPEKAAEFRLAGSIPADRINQSFRNLLAGTGSEVRVEKDAPIYFHPLLPGLLIMPSLIPQEIQKTLLNHIIHRDLKDPRHQTNMHLHFKLPYPGGEGSMEPSFFSYPPDSPVRFEPKDPSVHRPLSVKQVLERKLHWVTLGGQYDWTSRVYPGERPPDFPPDIAGFLEAMFPETLAQAAIVNFYTPGDTMMMHRDVSEEIDKGLVSLSIGCDSLFMITAEDMGKMSDEQKAALDGKGYLLLRIRSGDAIYMTQDARFAWHGVPKVLKDTCPEFLQDWPAEDGKYEEWKGWMKNKRININVRQMR